MTKKEYIKALRVELMGYPKDFQDDIIETFEYHFQEGIKQGKSEEEIINELGSIEDVLENIRLMYQENIPRKNTFEDDINDFGESLKSTFISFGKIASRVAKDASVYFDINEFNDSKTDDSEFSVIKDNVKEIEILNEGFLSGADINVNPSDELSYLFSYNKNMFSENNNPVTTALENDKLTFKLAKTVESLTLNIPETVEFLKVRISNGDIDICDIKLKEISLQSSLGDVEISRSKIDYINVDLKSGDIVIDEVTGNEADIYSIEGDIDIEEYRGSLNIAGNSGDIDVKNCFSSKYANIKTSAGDIIYNGSSQKINLESKVGDINSSIEGEFLQANIKTTSGDIDCNVAYDNYSARLDTVLGDIDVNIKGFNTARVSKNEYMVGNGDGKLYLSTTTGDIDLY